MADAPKLLGTDTLRQAYPKFNQAIDNANEALGTANTAKSTADTAKNTADKALSNSENTQTQLDTIVINGDSSVEAAQARVADDGTSFATLKERLDSSDALAIDNSQTIKDNTSHLLTSRINGSIIKTGYISRAIKELLKGTGRVAILGDSITDAGANTGATGGASAPENGYASHVGYFLREEYGAGTVFYNRGVAGHSTEQAYSRINTEIIPYDLDLVLVAVGTNDWNYGTTLAKFEADYRKIINDVTTFTNAEILCIGLGWFKNWTTAQSIGRETLYNDVIKKICAEKGIGYVDVYSAMKNAETYEGIAWEEMTFAGDPVHPNDAGHWIWAKEINTWLDFQGSMNENSYREKQKNHILDSSFLPSRFKSTKVFVEDINSSYYWGKSYYINSPSTQGYSTNMTFWGSAFKLIFAKGPNYGKFDIYVGGEYKGGFDGYSSSITFGNSIEIILEEGWHFIDIVNVGKNASAGAYGINLEGALIKNIEKEYRGTAVGGVRVNYPFTFYQTPIVNITPLFNGSAYPTVTDNRGVQVSTSSAGSTVNLIAKGY